MLSLSLSLSKTAAALSPLTSDHLNTHKIIKILETSGEYVLAQHETLRAFIAVAKLNAMEVFKWTGDLPENVG